MILSIVVPLLNEVENLPVLYQRLDEVGRGALKDVELEMLFVDDGSQDGSYQLLCDLARDDPRVRVIKLSRNFGSHGAVLAGFHHASGDYVTILAADLQDPPEDLARLLDRAKEGFDVVWAVRAQRNDPALSVALARVYYFIMRKVALPNYPPQGFDFVLLSRRVIDSVFDRAERNTSLFGQVVWAGFSQTSIDYEKAARRQGRSKWTLAKKIKLAIDSVVAFSSLPIRTISLMGIGVFFLGLLYAGFIVFHRLTSGVPVEGWASLMVAVLLLSGFQMLMLGVIGEYLWRTLDEARLRPPYLIAESQGKPLGSRGQSIRMAELRPERGSGTWS